MEGKKFDDGKLVWTLLPFEVIIDVVKVLMFGAKKYGDFNWKYVEPFKERYTNAALRHIIGGIDVETGEYEKGWLQGQIYDKETGIHNLAHSICCLIFLVWRDKGIK